MQGGGGYPKALLGDFVAVGTSQSVLTHAFSVPCIIVCAVLLRMTGSIYTIINTRTHTHEGHAPSRHYYS